jgi:hypothetical protein
VNIIAIVKLNIGWFAEALSQSPHDLSSSRYYASVINVYHQSCELIANLEELVDDEFEMVCRWGYIWSNAFSAAVRPPSL